MRDRGVTVYVAHGADVRSGDRVFYGDADSGQIHTVIANTGADRTALGLQVAPFLRNLITSGIPLRLHYRRAEREVHTELIRID